MYVFDLDGTIIDSTERHHLLMGKLLKEAGHEIPYNFAQDYMNYKASGHSGREYLEHRIQLPADLAVTIQQRWIAEIENQNWLEWDKLYTDAIPILEFLKEDNQRIMFLTIRRNKELLHKELQMLEINTYPDEVIVLSPKEQVHKGDVLKKVDEPIDFMIGDTEIDYDAALQADVKSYILNRGFRNRAFWRRREVRSYESLVYLMQLINNKSVIR